MTTTKETIRKAAILIDTLDPQTADALLDQMDAEQAARIREAVMGLRDVDPIERDRIVQQFLGGGVETPPDRRDDGFELDGSLAAKLAAIRDEPPAKAADSAGPFRSLHDATAETLASFLRHEHPQTVAVVVAHLPASRAADVVERFAPEFQADVLSRVSELDETNPEIIQEIDREIQSLLADEVRTTQRRSAGLSAVRAILAAADRGHRNGILANLAQHDRALAARIDDRRPGIDVPSILSPPPPLSPQMFEPLPAPPSAKHVEDRFFTDSQLTLSANTRAKLAADSRAADLPMSESEARASFGPIVDLSFDDLSRLDDGSLSHVLRVADPAMTWLALTGAKQAFVDRITRRLTSREARQFRNKMRQSGPLRLSDVDHAQNYLAELATALAAEGKIQLATSRRFAATA